MKALLSFVLSIFLVTGCTEIVPKLPEPPLLPRIEDPPPLVDPPYFESCSDIPERAILENAEANPYEILMACLIKNHPKQGRPTMSYHPLLGEVARARAQDMAEHGYYRDPPHVDRHGYGPNYYVCLSGYQAYFCPVGENVQANFVEITTASSGERRSSPEKALTGWLNSPDHRRAVLAENEIGKTRIYYGSGYAYTNSGPDYGGAPAHYWVFISTRPPLDE